MRLFALVALSSVSSLWAQEPQRIRVAVERQDSAGWIAVNPAHVFESGEKLRFRFSSSIAGYLYVINMGTSRNYELLFPRSDTGSNNRVEAAKDYVVPAGQGYFKVSGPPGQDVVYWLVSPVDMGKQYRPLPPPPAPSDLPPQITPRCDDSIFKARGDCVDTSAGVKPAGKLPDNMNSVVKPSPRELLFIQDNSIGKESVVVSSPAPLSGPVVYELRLAHR